jgi:mRNA-degrading endonuclease RelE of RelBE toxin-antitoxin system
MQIVETSAFTRRVTEILSDDEYRALQETLVQNPEMGALIVGTGGARKVRWAVKGGGKSGGARVIYYWANSRGLILMLTIYSKAEQDTLTDAQKKALRAIIQGYE